MPDSFERDSLEASLEHSIPLKSKSKLNRLVTQLSAIWNHIHWGKIGLFGISIFLFVLAITLMKTGASGLAPVLQDVFKVSNPANSLGFGWLFTYVIMSGSPVAAAALAFFDVGIIDHISTFTMIIGSRLGASFIVLFVGVIYVLRGRNWATSLGMGLLSLVVTGSTYLFSLMIGILFLRMEILQGVQIQSGVMVASILDAVFESIARSAAQVLPGWGLFIIGFGITMISFNLFDRCLPKMTLKESQVGRLAVFVYRPMVMFLLGAFVTLISMSVSVSLSLLVPLNDRGFIRRENVIPYILGANITTFIDTLFATLLLENPMGFTIVLAGMLSITLVSLVILITFYHRYEHSMLQFVNWITSENRHLYFFMAVIVIAPLILLLI